MTPDLNQFFGQIIGREQFALYMRKYMHASILLNFKDENGTYGTEIQEGYYWLTEFVEAIDPQLEKKQV